MCSGGFQRSLCAVRRRSNVQPGALPNEIDRNVLCGFRVHCCYRAARLVHCMVCRDKERWTATD